MRYTVLILILLMACGSGDSSNPDYSIDAPDFITPIGIEVVNETDNPVSPEEIDYYFRLVEAELGVSATEQIDGWYLAIYFIQAVPCGTLPNGYECWGIPCGNFSNNGYCGGTYTWYFEGFPRVTIAWNAPTMTLETSVLQHELRHHIGHMWAIPGWNIDREY